MDDKALNIVKNVLPPTEVTNELLSFYGRQFGYCEFMEQDPTGILLLREVLWSEVNLIIERNLSPDLDALVDSGEVASTDDLKKPGIKEGLRPDLQGALAALEDYQAVWGFFQTLQAQKS